MSAASATRFMHSRFALALMGAVTVCAALVAYEFADLPYPVGSNGLVRGWSGPWFDNPLANLVSGTCVTLLTALVFAVIVKHFNLLKSLTMYGSTSFLALQLGVISTVVYLCPGSLACLVMGACMALLFASYADRDAQRQIFLIFLMLSAGSAATAIFLYFIPVFILGCVQMRIFSLRTLLAMIMGLATPWIIFLGFGIIEFADLTFEWPWEHYQPGTLMTPYRVAVYCLTLFVLIAAWMQNLLKIVGYNARARALLSVVTVTLLFTIVMSLIDFGRFFAYMPMLNLCAALQLGHLFGVVHKQTKSYVAMLVIVLVYIAIFAWRIAICIL